METYYTLNDLLAELDRLWAMPADKFHTVGSHVYLNDTDDGGKICAKVEVMCDDVLIEKGSPNWKNIRILKEKGYEVRCTESDSFGWLGAAIEKDRRSLYFA